MQDYCVHIRLRSPLGTPWQSDTVFGHLAWHVARGRAGISIDEFLEPFRQGRPPFVLSDGFPEGLLPRPMLPLPSLGAQSAADHAAAKARRRSQFVSRADFDAIRRGEYLRWLPRNDPWVDFAVPHAAINRLTNTTGGGDEEEAGRFFETDLQALADPDTFGDTLTLYFRAPPPWNERVPEMLTELAALGFGRDRSTGSGAFEVVSVKPFDGFCALAGANGFVSLSSYCPARDDPTDGYWRTRLKYGKLGESAGDGNPFKRPLIQLEPGAVFRTDGAPRPFYGRAVAHIAPGMPQAIQCCQALAAPCILPTTRGEAGV